MLLVAFCISASEVLPVERCSWASPAVDRGRNQAECFSTVKMFLTILAGASEEILETLYESIG